MRLLTKSFSAVKGTQGWTVYGTSQAGYSFTVAEVCEGFITLRHARLFAVAWSRRCGKYGIDPASTVGRGVAKAIKDDYDDWRKATNQSIAA